MQQARSVGDNETLVEAALGFHRQSINLRVERVEATALLVELLEDPLRDHRSARLRVLTQLAECSVVGDTPADGAAWLSEAERDSRNDDPIEWRFGVAFAGGMVRLEQLDLEGAWRAFATARGLDHPAATAASGVRLAAVAIARGEPDVALAFLTSWKNEDCESASTGMSWRPCSRSEPRPGPCKEILIERSHKRTRRFAGDVSVVPSRRSGRPSR